MSSIIISTHRRSLIILLSGIFFCKGIFAQTAGSSLPNSIDTSGDFLFYFHGAVVTERGDMGRNDSYPEWGPYEFYHILDSLKSRDFNVIGEIRKKGKPDSFYVSKVAREIDSLKKAGLKTDHILLLGASAGSELALRVAAQLQDNQLHVAIMGGCWPDAVKDYASVDLYGQILSIIEKTDPHGSCRELFVDRKHILNFLEIKLNTGKSHGFIYKPYRAWVDPVIKWFRDHN